MSSNKLSDLNVLEIYLLVGSCGDGSLLQFRIEVLDLCLYAKWHWPDVFDAHLLLP